MSKRSKLTSDYRYGVVGREGGDGGEGGGGRETKRRDTDDGTDCCGADDATGRDAELMLLLHDSTNVANMSVAI